jgi:hypothetical protein
LAIHDIFGAKEFNADFLLLEQLDTAWSGCFCVADARL